MEPVFLGIVKDKSALYNEGLAFVGNTLYFDIHILPSKLLIWVR